MAVGMNDCRQLVVLLRGILYLSLLSVSVVKVRSDADILRNCSVLECCRNLGIKNKINLLLRVQSCEISPVFTPGLGQNIASRVSPAARSSAFLSAVILVHCI